MPAIKLFQAKKIITMDRNRPEAAHVATPPEALKDIPVAGTVLGGQSTGDA
jgi:hypothetical protein